MKKTTLTIVLIFVVIFAFSSLVACAQDENLNGNSTTPTTTTHATTTTKNPSDNTGNNPSDSGNTPSDSGDKTGGSDIEILPPQDSSKKNFEGLVFSNATYDYDGTEKTISVTGNVPTNATITYSGGENKNGATNVGTYTITARIDADGYNSKLLTATLKIKGLDFSGITFSGESFEYDEAYHKITVTGNIPSTATVTYTGGEDGKNGAKSVGTYNISAVISGAGYNSLTLNATIKITSKTEPLSVAVYDSKLYFQNPLDNNYLYCYDGSNINLIDDYETQYFATANNKLYCISSGITSSISSYDGTNVSYLLDVNAEYLTSDGTYLYYACNNTLFNTDSNGIYKVAISDLENSNSDPVATRLTASKATYLTYVGNYIYFSNSSDSGKLYRVSTSATNATATKVYDYKVSDIVAKDNVLYFTRHFTLSNASAGAAIYSINVSGSMTLPLADDDSKITKITMSKGKYLTIIDDYIYFVNTDMVTSNIFGDGIYKAPIDGSGWVSDSYTLLEGSAKVIDGETDEVYALTSINGYLYYYRANDKHLHCYNISSEEELDLMSTFVAPEKVETITTYYEDMDIYNGELYYINMNDGGTMWKYNISNKNSYRVSSMQVADLAIHGDYIYFATVRLLVNYDLYKMNLKTSELTRISTEKCYHLSFADDYIYYANYSGSNTLNRMKYDGTEDAVVFSDETVNDYDTCIYNGKVYFVANDELYEYTISTGTAAVTLKAKSNDYSKLYPNQYVIKDGCVYMMYDGYANNYIVKYNISTGEVTEIAKLNTVDGARSFFVYGNYVYYYRNVTAGSSSKGLYRINTTSSTLTSEKVTTLDGYYMCSAVVYGTNVYFLDVWQVKDTLPAPASTAELCSMSLSTYKVTVLTEE